MSFGKCQNKTEHCNTDNIILYERQHFEFKYSAKVNFRALFEIYFIYM